MRVWACVLAGLAVVSALHGGEEGSGEPPRDIGLVERARVRLAVVDVVVVDEDERSVSGLSIDDFEVVIGNETRRPDTLDVSCQGGGAPEPKAVRRIEDRAPALRDGSPKRIALVIDYLHLSGTALVDSLEQMKQFVAGRRGSDDQFLLVALTGGIRIEQMFSSDAGEVLRALDRMEDDITLWNGNFAHLNELSFFEGLEALLELLSVIPGSKGLAFYSVGGGPDPLEYDLEYRKTAAVASAARVAIYPVVASGLGDPAACPT
jgi:VWFA-related protein